MNTHTSTTHPERRSGRSAAERQLVATIGAMADSIIDLLIRGGVADEAGLAQYGFMRSEITTHQEAAMAHAHECAVAALCARIEALEVAIKPLALSSPLSGPPGVDETDWYDAVKNARAALAKAGAT